MPAQTVIKLRRDTAANWDSINPILAAGEMGIETDTGLHKFGDGTAAWGALPYSSASRITQQVKNVTGSLIPKGSVVYISGATGGDAQISLADADAEATSSKVIGLTTAAIANDGFGTVIEQGLLAGVNTASATAGQSVWLSSTAGQFIFGAPPAKPAHSVYLGVVVRVHATEGEILVKVQNGYELNELHDVDAGSPSTGQVLQWNGSMWVNASVDALPSQSGQNGKYLTTDGTTASWGTITIPPGTEVSDTPPSSPSVGQLWWESDTGILYIYYDGFWVEAVSGIVGPQGPAGVVQQPSAPTNTSVLWVDTDDPAEPVAVPAGGSTGQTLVKTSNSDYATAWSNPPSPNYIINGAFDFWQRGTSFTPTAAAFTYTADRWDSVREVGTSGATITRQTAGLTGFNFSLRYQRDSGNTSTTNLWTAYRLDTESSIPLQGQSVTLSFYAKAGANFSGASSQIRAVFYSGTGTNQGGYPSGWTGSSTRSDANYTISTSWQRYSVTVSIPSNATQIGFLVGYAGVGTAGANDWFEITGVQLEAGSVATPFRRAANSLQGELAACQRYYFRISPNATTKLLGIASAANTTQGGAIIPFPVQMRIAPTALETSGTANQYAVNFAGTQTVCSLVPSYAGLTTEHAGFVTVTVAAGLTAGQAGRLTTDVTNGANAYLGWSAEL